MADVIMIVDDEDSVRQTFLEWLQGELPGAQVFTANDAATALRLANEQTVDLAVIDWNLGAGQNGLQLLEDLHVFQPDIVAILVTGYANQATPLDALRMGVRDYLDKGSALTRASFLHTVCKQLDRIRPMKVQKQLQLHLQRFQEAVEQVLSLNRAVAHQPSSWLKDDLIHELLNHLCRFTGAVEGCLILRQSQSLSPAEPIEEIHYWTLNKPKQTWPIPFRQSLAATIATLQPSIVMTDIAVQLSQSEIKLTPLEEQYAHVLGLGMDIGLQTLAIVELFASHKTSSDKHNVFSPNAKNDLQQFQPLMQSMLRQWLTAQSGQQLLLNTLEHALAVSQTLNPQSVKDQHQLRQQIVYSLQASPFKELATDEIVQLTDQIQSLVQKHGQEAIRFCQKLITELDRLLMSWSRHGLEDFKS